MTDINFKVPYTTILKIDPHPNADRLEIATCYDFHIVVQKEKYSAGDRIIFIPPDSILPSWLEEKLFDKNSKIKLNKSRVQQIRIRGFASQGMIIDPQDLVDHLGLDWFRKLGSYEPEEDLAELLGIIKYEPPTRLSTPKSLIKRNKPLE